MPRLEQRDETYCQTVRGMCRECREVVPARVFFRDGAVYQQALCPRHGGEPHRIAASAAWYQDALLRSQPDHGPLPGSRPPRHGCPHDCGPCTWHATPCRLPVVSITNACQLRCPICFTYNRPDRRWFIGREEMRAVVDRMVETAGPLDLINLTGGEPTLHPELPELLACCRRPEIGRITVNSNGLRLAEDPELCRRLAELEVCVVLSCNTFAPDVSRRLHGRDLVAVKRRAIDNLTRAGVRMTLLQVLVREVNEEAIAPLLAMLRQNDLILSYTIQTMTHTGQGGSDWPTRAPIPVDETAALVAAASDGELAADDFHARPGTHPLCYRLAYLLRDGDGLTPFTRFAAADRIAEHLRDSYLLRPEAAGDLLRELVDTCYARGDAGHLHSLRRLQEQLFPPDATLDDFTRQRRAEDAVRTIYLHAHMDEDTFDCSRAMLCPDQVPVAPDRLIPACTYNLFYRQRDPRFYVSGDGA